MTELQLYPKIQSLFKRDPVNNHKTFLEGQYTTDALSYLRRNVWEATEKVDGTNMRIHWQDQQLFIGGRTERADIPPQLLEHCSEIGAKLSSYLPDKDVTLYGEGYGPKIQGGGAYREDQGFILFDVWSPTAGWWRREMVEAIGKELAIPVTPIVWSGTLEQAAWCIKNRLYVDSRLKDGHMEGWVLRPDTELLTFNLLVDKRGERVITKLKLKDYPR